MQPLVEWADAWTQVERKRILVDKFVYYALFHLNATNRLKWYWPKLANLEWSAWNHNISKALRDSPDPKTCPTGDIRWTDQHASMAAACDAYIAECLMLERADHRVMSVTGLSVPADKTAFFHVRLADWDARKKKLPLPPLDH